MRKAKVNMWQRLPQGYWDSSYVFYSTVMDILAGLNVIIYIDVVFFIDDTEDEHLDSLKK